jgi:phosphatidate cytidylyltransferase
MKRVLTALLLIPVVLLVTYQAPSLIVWLVLAAVSLLALREFFSLAEKLGLLPYRAAGYGACALLVLLRGVNESAWIIGFALALLSLALWRAQPLEAAFGAAASTLLGVVYIGGPFLLARELHELSPHWLFFVLLINWVGDSAAYYAGQFGRHKLARRVSPNKTWEGTIASLCVSAPVGAAFLVYFEPQAPPLAISLGIAAVTNIAAQLGDLSESALKRGAQIKDSGQLLPGHGGMLDRVDGMLFSLPACYFLVVWLVWLKALQH